jgi:hypothetical protein
MAQDLFALDFCTALLARAGAHSALLEHLSESGGPFLSFRDVEDDSNAGYLRLWSMPDREAKIDRLIHCRLCKPPVDTHLLFIFGDPGSAVPHFHAQVVQFSPDACVYNADIIPRLDPVDHPEYFRAVYGPVTTAYWRATSDRQNICALASANPAVTLYLSPWGITAGRPTTRDELLRVTPSILAYLDHCLSLARMLPYPAPAAGLMRARDRRHLDLLHSEKTDPRAWKGVVRIVGADPAARIRDILSVPINESLGRTTE